MYFCLSFLFLLAFFVFQEAMAPLLGATFALFSLQVGQGMAKQGPRERRRGTRSPTPKPTPDAPDRTGPPTRRIPAGRGSLRRRPRSQTARRGQSPEEYPKGGEGNRTKPHKKGNGRPGVKAAIGASPGACMAKAERKGHRPDNRSQAGPRGLAPGEVPGLLGVGPGTNPLAESA